MMPTMLRASCNGPRLPRGIAANQTKPVLRSDNGATLKASTVLAMLHWLGIKPSYSRPRVSNDNAFAESAFRTAKYRAFARHGFKDLDQARDRACDGRCGVGTDSAHQEPRSTT